MHHSDFFKLCDGIKNEKIASTYHSYNQLTKTKDNITIPTDKDYYIKIHMTATKGTIGRIIGLDADVYHNDRISDYSSSYIFEVDSRKKPGRIRCNCCYILDDEHDGSTKWVRNVNKHSKKEIKAPITKYKQELQVGDIVIGLQYGSNLCVGKVTRWSNHNVWVNKYGLNQEVKLYSNSEIFSLGQDADNVEEAMSFAILSGFKTRY